MRGVDLAMPEPCRRIVFVGGSTASALAETYRRFVGIPAGEDVRALAAEDLTARHFIRAVAEAAVLVAEDRACATCRRHARPDVPVLSIPAVEGWFLWPLAYRARGPRGERAFGDRFLDAALKAGTAPEEAARRYGATDITALVSPGTLRDRVADELDARGDVLGGRIARALRAVLPSRQLFLDPLTPAPWLAAIIVDALFDALDAPAAARALAVAAATANAAGSELPLHPAVIAHLGIRYLDRETRYLAADGGARTFFQHAAGYARTRSDIREERASAPRPTPDVERRIADAHALRERGDGAAAGAMLQAIVDGDPRCVPAQRALGELRLSEGDADGARACLEAAAAAAPADGDVLHLLALCRLRARDFAGALSAAELALAADPISADRRNVLGEALEELGRRDEAVAMIDGGLAAGCANGQTFSLLGNLLLRRGDLAGAEDAFRRGVAIAPDRHDMRGSLADVEAMRRA